jgi:hypothetical protein
MRINAKFTSSTVPLWKRKLFVSRSYQILVLTIVLSRLRHTYAKNSVKNYQGGAPPKIQNMFFLSLQNVNFLIEILIELPTDSNLPVLVFC